MDGSVATCTLFGCPLVLVFPFISGVLKGEITIGLATVTFPLTFFSWNPSLLTQLTFARATLTCTYFQVTIVLSNSSSVINPITLSIIPLPI